MWNEGRGSPLGRGRKVEKMNPRQQFSGDATLLLLELRWLGGICLRIQSAWFIHLKSWTDNSGSSSSPSRYDHLSQAAFSLSVFLWPSLEAPGQLIIAQPHTALGWTHLSFITVTETGAGRNSGLFNCTAGELHLPAPWRQGFPSAFHRHHPSARQCWAPSRYSTLSWMSVWIIS